MIKFLKSLFTKSKRPKAPEFKIVEDDRDFGFIDYDGMGNQGRFPVDKDK
ncbi:MAG: hypothetical protein VXW71_00300 [Actinomycetota bacterium]|nr:hypothetical protein [Actinomycetota bacterium]